MESADARVDDVPQMKIDRRRLWRVMTGAGLGSLFLGNAATGFAKRKGGRKKKVCKCAIGFHCEKGKCVPDA
jgi:hypothetical protein